ncbi:MAG: type II toxin-antitoxin system RelE/ParE family toxin [Ignavibacteria bacterium]
MVKVRWTPQSLEDIFNIAEYIAIDSEKYAKIQTERFFDSVEILTTHPKAGRIVPETKNNSLRELVLGNYRLVYKIVSKTSIDIITIHHSKRLLFNNPAIGDSN